MSMMYIVGNPGSGKTYLAVHKLYEHFIDPQSKDTTDKYTVAYTNINEFDFSKSDKIKPLHLDLFYENLIILHSMYLNKATDSVLIEKAKELNLFKCLFVIDECHSNIFDRKKDKIIIWWLTYHRHLYHDIWLITQNLSLVDTQYKKIAEFFYKAVDGSKRLFHNRFKYVLYNGSTMYQKRDVVPGGGISLKFNPEIYSLYHSGNDTKHKSYLKLYFFISLFLIVILMIFFLRFKYFFSDSDHNLTSNQKNFTNTIHNKNSPKSFTPPKINDLEISFLYTFNCFNLSCQIDNSKKLYPYSLVKGLIDLNPPVFSDKIKHSNDSFTLLLGFNRDILKFLKGATHEKNSVDSNPSFINFSSKTN